MMIGDRHLPDEHLLDLCMGEMGGRGDREHLDACSSCESRRATLAGLLADTAAVAEAQADAAFTPERLAKQRARILQRIEQDGAPGRVITFPLSHGYSRRLLRPRPAARWVAGAAVAGLLIGVLAGHLAHELPAQAVQEVVADTAESTFAAEEEFLSQLDTAIEGTGGVLRPLDDMTPRVWEIAAQ